MSTTCSGYCQDGSHDLCPHVNRHGELCECACHAPPATDQAARDALYWRSVADRYEAEIDELRGRVVSLEARCERLERAAKEAHSGAYAFLTDLATLTKPGQLPPAIEERAQAFYEVLHDLRAALGAEEGQAVPGDLSPLRKYARLLQALAAIERHIHQAGESADALAYREHVEKELRQALATDYDLLPLRRG